MILSNPAPSPFDLTFWLFRTRVRIHPGYWLTLLFLGWAFFQPDNFRFSSNGVPEFGIFVVAVTLSILLHEFGHIFAGWACGGKGEVLLHGMGGLAIHEDADFSPWQHIGVALAGPAIQLTLYAALVLALPAPASFDSPAGRLFLEQLLFISLYWPLFNLLPLWPLDGGQVTRQVCILAAGRNGIAISLWISLAVAVAIALNTLAPVAGLPQLIPWRQDLLLVLFMALFAFAAWNELKAAWKPRRVFDDNW